MCVFEVEEKWPISEVSGVVCFEQGRDTHLSNNIQRMVSKRSDSILLYHPLLMSHYNVLEIIQNILV